MRSLDFLYYNILLCGLSRVSLQLFYELAFRFVAGAKGVWVTTKKEARFLRASFFQFIGKKLNTS